MTVLPNSSYRGWCYVHVVKALVDSVEHIADCRQDGRGANSE